MRVHAMGCSPAQRKRKTQGPHTLHTATAFGFDPSSIKELDKWGGNQQQMSLASDGTSLAFFTGSDAPAYREGEYKARGAPHHLLGGDCSGRGSNKNQIFSS